MRAVDPRLLSRALSACGGFLLAVLWMDLMFDVQVLGYDGGALPDAVLASIAAYYRRVTTEAHPMNLAVGGTMIATLVGTGYQAVAGSGSMWRRIARLVAAGLPILLALAVIFPDAVRLGSGEGPPAARSDLARSIFRAHAACLASIAVYLWLQLVERSSGGHPTRIDDANRPRNRG